MASVSRPKRATEKVDKASRPDASVACLKRTFLEHLFYTQGRFIQGATLKDGYMALAYTVRDQLLHRWVKTVEKCMERGIKLVSYLSVEFQQVQPGASSFPVSGQLGCPPLAKGDFRRNSGV